MTLLIPAIVANPFCFCAEKKRRDISFPERHTKRAPARLKYSTPTGEFFFQIHTSHQQFTFPLGVAQSAVPPNALELNGTGTAEKAHEEDK